MRGEYLCSGCDAPFTSRELGDPRFDFRHTRACFVRYVRPECAWRWPGPYALRGAFRLGESNAIEVAVRYNYEHDPITKACQYYGSVLRLRCEARARYTEFMRR